MPSRSSTIQFVQEVPTILYFLKQTVDTPVPRGRVRLLQGFLPAQNSTAQVFPHIVDIPVRSGDLQGIRPGQVSTHFAPRQKRCGVSGWQVSAELGGYVTSSTLSAHQMARGGEPLDSVWLVQLSNDVTSKTHYWNTCTRQSVWKPPAGIEVVWVGTQDEEGFLYHWHKVFPLLSPG